MDKYRLKQTLVDAVQFVDGRYGEAIDFCPRLLPAFEEKAKEGEPEKPKLRVCEGGELDGTPVANGDWIVRHADATFTVVDDDTFREDFEAA